MAKRIKDSKRSRRRYLMSGLRELVRPGVGVYVSRSWFFSSPGDHMRPWCARIWEPGKRSSGFWVQSRDWNELLWNCLQTLLDYGGKHLIRGSRKRPSWMELK